MSRRKPAIFNYYEDDPVAKTAKCTKCSRIISYKSTSYNLKSHLKLVHIKAYTSFLREYERSKGTGSSDITEMSLNYPGIFKYYKPTTDNKTTKCTACRKRISYKCAIAHLKSAHYNDYISFKNETRRSSKQSLSDVSDSSASDTEMSREYPELFKYYKDNVADETAKCTMCHKRVSYNNLEQHLKAIHSSEYMSYKNEIKLSSEEISPDVSGKGRLMHPNTAILLKYYHNNVEDKTANCRICDRTISYKSTITNLKSHLRLMHVVEFNEYLSERQPRKSEIPTNRRSSSESIPKTDMARKHPKLFKYYDNNNQLERKANCAICHKIICYKSTISNLKCHLKLVHPRDYAAYLDDIKPVALLGSSSSDSSTKESKASLKHPGLFKHYKNKGSKRAAICRMCGKVVSYKSTITNLKTHLKLRHANEFAAYLRENTNSSKKNKEERYSNDMPETELDLFTDFDEVEDDNEGKTIRSL